MTQRLPTAAARKSFATVLRDCAAGERIKLTRYNKTIAVIIPKKDLTDLEDCEKSRPGVGSAQTAHPKRTVKGNRHHGSDDER
jgi:antitoxin (DNA-binding transcriptional repressor) of toxin-antitoxin stability system